MKTTTTVSRLLAVGAIALGVATSALAAGPEHCGRDAGERAPMGMHHGGGFVDLRGIDLSADQLKEVARLRDEEQKSMREKAQALHDQHDALRKLVQSDAYTPAAAGEIIGKISAAQGEMAKLRADHANKLYKLLTAEQRTRVQQNELIGARPDARGGKPGDQRNDQRNSKR